MTVWSDVMGVGTQTRGIGAVGALLPHPQPLLAAPGGAPQRQVCKTWLPGAPILIRFRPNLLTLPGNRLLRSAVAHSAAGTGPIGLKPERLAGLFLGWELQVGFSVGMQGRCRFQSGFDFARIHQN